MQQVKLFKGIENDLTTLEAEVNAWIRQNAAKVVSITGNLAPQTVTTETKATGAGRSYYPASDVLLIIVYEPASP
jgi:hypothetical protein